MSSPQPSSSSPAVCSRGATTSPTTTSARNSRRRTSRSRRPRSSPTEGRTDLVKFADQRLDTGAEAEAYASFINGHLEGIAGGATYADLGATESAAKADVKAAVDAGQPQAEVDELQATADDITGQRNSLFKGETLRGLLLSAYAWSTVGTIAGIAAIGAFIAAGLMAILVGLGLVHHRRTPKTA